jgi:predicted DNA-binding transcriptional regulator AlpA
MADTKILIPAGEAAKMLSMGRSTFWAKVRAGVLPGPIHIGGLTRWRVSDLTQFAQSMNPTTPSASV